MPPYKKDHRAIAGQVVVRLPALALPRSGLAGRPERSGPLSLAFPSSRWPYRTSASVARRTRCVNALPGTFAHWSGHLAIGYDYIDQSLLRMNISGLTGIIEDACRACQGTYGMKPPSSDPASIGAADGLVKLHRSGIFNVASKRLPYDIALKNRDSNVLAVALVQLQDDGTLQFEVVAGKTPPRSRVSPAPRSSTGVSPTETGPWPPPGSEA